MSRRRALVAISAAQLAAGVAGQLIALRDRRSFDIALLRWRGDPENVLKDSWLQGTGLSAPIYMLATQAVATTRLATAPSQLATRYLGALGALMACGYLVEREFRSAFSPTGLDPAVTPVAAAGFSLSVAMALTGLQPLPQARERRIVEAVAMEVRGAGRRG
jgi:hypothetical protein